MKKDSKKQPVENTKRRATMNSRSTYEEDMFAKILEESQAIMRVARGFSLMKRDREEMDNEYANPDQRLNFSSPPSDPAAETRNVHVQVPSPHPRCPGTASLPTRPWMMQQAKEPQRTNPRIRTRVEHPHQGPIETRRCATNRKNSKQHNVQKLPANGTLVLNAEEVMVCRDIL